MWSDRRPRACLCLTLRQNGHRFGWVLPLPVLVMLADILEDMASLVSCLPLPQKSRLPVIWCRSGARVISRLLCGTMRGDGLEFTVELTHKNRRVYIGLV